MKRIILAATLAALAAPAFADGHGVVRMGTEGAYPPYNFLNDAGEVDGFEREVGDELCARAELTCEWVTNEWDSIIPNLTSGNYDTIIAGMSITAERDEVIDFTQKYTQPDQSAYMAMSADVDLKGALSKQNIRVSVPSRFTVGVSNKDGVMLNAAERLLGKTTDQIRDIAKDILFGQLRLVVATMDIEEINSDRDKFLFLLHFLVLAQYFFGSDCCK